MLKEYDQCILEMIENGTYFNVEPKEPIMEYIYENIEDTLLDGIYELPAKQEFELDYCNI